MISDMQLFLGEDYIINEHITIYNPTLLEIVGFGEEEYINTIGYFLCGLQEIEKGFLRSGSIKPETLTGLRFIYCMRDCLPQTKTRLIFGDLDLQKFNLVMNTETKEEYLIDYDNGIIIDNNTYQDIIHSIKKIFNSPLEIAEETEKTSDLNERIREPLYKPYVTQYPYFGIMPVSTFHMLCKGASV